MMGFHPANFGLHIGLSVLELGRGTRQRDGQTDTYRPSFCNAPLYRGRWYNNQILVLVIHKSVKTVTYNKRKDEGADVIADAWRNVGSELLERGQESLQLAELASATCRRQLLLLGQVRHLSARGRRMRHHVTSGWRQRVADYAHHKLTCLS